MCCQRLGDKSRDGNAGDSWRLVWTGISPEAGGCWVGGSRGGGPEAGAPATAQVGLCAGRGCTFSTLALSTQVTARLPSIWACLWVLTLRRLQCWPPFQPVPQQSPSIPGSRGGLRGLVTHSNPLTFASGRSLMRKRFLLKLSFRTLAQLKALILVKPWGEERHQPVSQEMHKKQQGSGFALRMGSCRSNAREECLLLENSQDLLLWKIPVAGALFFTTYRIWHSN